MYAVRTYMFMNIKLCMYIVLNLYIHVHNCKYVYVHSTDMSQAVQLHSRTSLLIMIRPDQPCDTGESQFSAGSFPSELPGPPCESVICLLLEQLVKSSLSLY